VSNILAAAAAAAATATAASIARHCMRPGRRQRKKEHKIARATFRYRETQKSMTSNHSNENVAKSLDVCLDNVYWLDCTYFRFCFA
jgi:hypothetical protein